MGVHGLWELLAPVGRRVSVETLAGKKLAIDASIWMVQFMKAMRDEKGEMVRNAHLIGFFRRICKLLFLRTKPVFVFDGGTPALKRRTVIARRRQRENAQAKIRKTAEKLLLNHLKAMRLKELAKDIEDNKQKKNNSKGKNVVVPVESDVAENSARMKDKVRDQETLDELLAASLAAEDAGNLNTSEFPSACGIAIEEEDDDGDEEMILPAMHGKIDPSVLASLPPSMQLDLLVQMREGLMAENRQKYQKVKKAPAKFSELQIQAYLKTVAFRREIDQVQKAAAGRGIGGMQTSRIASESNREFIFSSSFTGDKEMLTATGVQKIDGIEHRASGKDPGSSDSINRISAVGQTSCATDSGVNEVISGSHDDVETFLDERGRVRVSRVRAMGMRMTRDLQRNLDLMKEIEQEKMKEKSSNLEATRNENFVGRLERSSKTDHLPVDSDKGSDEVIILDDVLGQDKNQKSHQKPMLENKTLMEISFLDDENGCRGTNDDVDDLFAHLAAGNSGMVSSAENASLGVIDDGHLERSSKTNHLPVDSDKGSDNVINIDDVLGQDKNQKCHQKPVLKNQTLMEISFLEDENGCRGTNNDVDDLFAHLAAGNSVMLSSAENASLGKPSHPTILDCTLMEGSNDEIDVSLGDVPKEVSQSFLDKENSDESEVDWEEGVSDVPGNASSCVSELDKAVSRGSLEEDADIQEALRRSLEDYHEEKRIDTSTINNGIDASLEMVNWCTTSECPVQVSTSNNDMVGSHCLPRKNDPVQQVSVTAVSGLKSLDQIDEIDKLQIGDPSERQSTSSIKVTGKIEKVESLDKPCESYPVSSVQVLSEETRGNTSADMEIPDTDLAASSKPTEFQVTANQCWDTYSEDGVETRFTGSDGTFQVHSHVSAAMVSDSSQVNLVHAHREVYEDVPSHGLFEDKSSMDLVAPDDEIDQNVLVENSSTPDIMEVQMEMDEASLDEEMLRLRQERIDLGDEQRKLERNAESVSSEMFAECQELLQMFGLPYIIAPMEAEAQCAYMELSNLVDGVVTDDSDVFLFGARSVYKNIFDDRKYVETYFMKDIENELGLSRDQLIRMAMLLGSDYTEGVSGIGIVNAIEVVHAFPEEDGLKKFREWLESPDPTILGTLDSRTGSSVKKRGSKLSSCDADCSKNDMESGFSVDTSTSDGHDVTNCVTEGNKTKQIFMDRHRNVSKNWHIPSSFPSETVVSAYVSPQVDKSTEPFSWGKPDLIVLRKLCWEKFGWSNQKSDDLLLPVLKEYNKHETQLRLEAFYTFNERFAKIRSSRIKKAVKGIAGNRSAEVMDDLPKEASKTRKKTTAPSEPVKNKSDDSWNGDNIHAASQNTSEKTIPKQMRKGTECEPMPSEVQDSNQPVRDEGGRKTKKGSSVRGRGRGSGRGRVSGSGRGRGRGRGRGKGTPHHESTETSCSSGSDENDEMEMQNEATESISKVRRSSRPRKHVKYTVNDIDSNTLSKSSGWNDRSCAEEATEPETFHNGGILESAAYGLSERSPILNDATQQDHLEMGGGFCMDEAEPESEPVNVIPNRTEDFELQKEDPTLQDDYLKMGGGWCVDDDEPDNTVHPVLSCSRDSDELHDTRRMDDARDSQTSDYQNNERSDNRTNVNVLLEEPGTCPISSSTTGLSAMPSLRRKRRKT